MIRRASSSETNVILLFFFFSSRRRHTRSKRDWSSDVCSSDLVSRLIAELGQLPSAERLTDWAFERMTIKNSLTSSDAYRSEERRVGKECRCQWAQCE